LLPFLSLLDVRVGVFAIGLTIFIGRIIYGMLQPEMDSIINGMVREEEKEARNALASIGGRRKKIGAIVALMIPVAAIVSASARQSVSSVSRVFDPVNLYWGIGAFAFTLAIVTQFILGADRPRGRGPLDRGGWRETASPDLSLSTIQKNGN
jgi:hypothetical protein